MSLVALACFGLCGIALSVCICPNRYLPLPCLSAAFPNFHGAFLVFSVVLRFPTLLFVSKWPFLGVKMMTFGGLSEHFEGRKCSRVRQKFRRQLSAPLHAAQMVGLFVR